VFDGMDRKAGVVLYAGKPFFLGCGEDLAVPDETGRTVVIKGGNAQDMDGCHL
jgi:hypothetical protein